MPQVNKNKPHDVATDGIDKRSMTNSLSIDLNDIINNKKDKFYNPTYKPFAPKSASTIRLR